MSGAGAEGVATRREVLEAAALAGAALALGPIPALAETPPAGGEGRLVPARALPVPATISPELARRVGAPLPAGWKEEEGAAAPLVFLTAWQALVDAAAKRVRLADELRLALLHTIAWHHGPPAGQAPGAASPEALALWRVNTLEVSVKARLEGSGPIDGE